MALNLFGSLVGIGDHALVTHQVPHQFSLYRGHPTLKLLPKHHGVHREGEQVQQQLAGVPLDQGGEGVEVGQPPKHDPTMVNVREVATVEARGCCGGRATVFSIPGLSEVLEDQYIILGIQLTQITFCTGGSIQADEYFFSS